ncbi:MAG: aldo/keto reductase [Thermoleophilaceae bacterium]
MSPLGLGLAALGRPGYIDIGHAADLGADRSVEAMRAHAHAVLDAAYELGIRYFDAARSYGRAEEFLASWLDEHSPADVTVGSKWGYVYTADWRADAEVHEVKDHSLENLKRQYAESRELLGDRLALYQVHSATLDGGVLEDERVLDELRRLRAEGLVVGLTLSGPRQADALRRALELDVFETVQATWNLLETSVGEALVDAHRAGWGVIAKEAVANGRLTARGDAAEREPLRSLAAHREASPDQLALAAALSQPFADVVLSGATTATQLKSNAGAVGLALPWQELDALEGMAEPAERYWEERSELPWT